MPWAPLIDVVYEHLHRYHFARQFVRGKHVLDVASGEGFGAEILATDAASVRGVDVDAATVEHAARRYPAAAFAVDDATRLDSVPDDAVDVVVAFEVIEHLADHDQMLEAVRRVLRPGGLLVISTPNKAIYSAPGNPPNPFHVRELALEEFEALLSRSFAHVQLYAQGVYEGSRMEAIGRTADASPTHIVRVQAGDGGWQEASPPAPRYVVAVASDRELSSLPGSSMLIDGDRTMMRRAVGEARRAERG